MSFREVEFCDICGEQISEKEDSCELCDGSLCEACAQRLSPWYDAFECADVEDIQQQLDAREENLEKVRAFHTTRQLGEDIKIAIDDDAKCFMVIETDDILTENPDVISFEEVIDCSVCALENKEKLKDDAGNAFTRYTYDFEIEIDLDHPYLDTIVFNLNPQSLVLDSSERSFLGFGGFDPEGDPTYAHYMKQGQLISDILTEMEE